MVRIGTGILAETIKYFDRKGIENEWQKAI